MQFLRLFRNCPPTLIIILLIAFIPSVSSVHAAPGDEITYYLLTDHLGSVDVVLDEQGEVVERRDFLPYGSERVTESVADAPETNHKFTGKELDVQTGLHYYGARYYDSEIGRFTSIDPLVMDEAKMTHENLQAILENPQKLNAYTYALNNPLYYVDLFGESAQSDFAWGVGSFFDGVVSFTVSAGVLVKGAATLDAKDALFSQVLYLHGRDKLQSSINTLATGEKIKITEGAELIDNKLEKVISSSSKAASSTMKFLANGSNFADGAEEMVKMYERGDDIINTVIEGTAQLINEVPDAYEQSVQAVKEKANEISNWLSDIAGDVENQ